MAAWLEEGLRLAGAGGARPGAGGRGVWGCQRDVVTAWGLLGRLGRPPPIHWRGHPGEGSPRDEGVPGMGASE